MKIFVDLNTNKILNVYEDNHEVQVPINNYVVNANNISDKIVPKGFWREIKDDNGNAIWEESSVPGLLRPSKGYIVSSQMKVKFKTYPQMWSVEDVIKEKYEIRLKNKKMKNVYYQEFIKFDEVKFEGNLNIGKKICIGQGILIHELKGIKEFVLELEYTKDLPQVSLSSDNETWTKVNRESFSHKFKKETDKFYLKINDYENILTAYSIYY